MRAWIGAMALLAAALPSGRARAWACPDGIVSTGDTKSEVHLKCGEPTLFDQRLDEIYLRTGEGHWLHRTRFVEEWTYDFGPDRLLRILVFHDGRLVQLKSGGYGSKRPPGVDDRRIPIISIGDSKAQVLLKWGEPGYADHRREVRTVYGKRGGIIERTVTIDEWTYDFGPDRLVRLLVFENGRLVANRTGSYGKKASR